MKGRKIRFDFWSSALFLFICLLISACGDPQSSEPVNLLPESQPVQNLELNSTENHQTSGVNTKISKTVRPPKVTNSTSATFKFYCTNRPCTYKCKLDSNPWKKCRSPKTYTQLEEGAHLFRVKATNSSGQTDPTPAQYAWTIDFTPPETNITSHPADPSNFSTAQFLFTCSEPTCNFECQMDANGWSACESPQDYSGLSEGIHIFEVRAIDLAGNPDPTPASYSWTIDLPGEWIAISITNAPSARALHTAIWTGTQMIIWGGWNGTSVFNTGGRYDPLTDSWTPTNTTGAPLARYSHTAVWTETVMIVWGGWNGVARHNTGSRYDPATNSWTATTTTGAPLPRDSHTAVWTGTEMIIWGGWNGSAKYNTGGRYNPATNSWTTTTTTGAPSARYLHTAVWTGTEMIIFGGEDKDGFYLNSGAKYNPSSNTWTALSSTNAPLGRKNHTAIWTGTRMIIWGGYGNFYLNSGASYDPSQDSWSPLSSENAPYPRASHTAIWTGTEMIIWGGYHWNAGYLGTGGRYNPDLDLWTETNTTNAPSKRQSHTAVWTGSAMIIWGGEDGNYLNSGARYLP